MGRHFDVNPFVAELGLLPVLPLPLLLLSVCPRPLMPMTSATINVIRRWPLPVQLWLIVHPSWIFEGKRTAAASAAAAAGCPVAAVASATASATASACD